MSDESRIAKLEAHVRHMQSDMCEMKAMLYQLRDSFESFKIEVSKEFAAFKAEVTRDIASFKAEVTRDLASFKVEVAREHGAIWTAIESVKTSVESLRTAIERAKLWMLVTGVGTILSVWGAAFALARLLKP